MNLTTCDNDPGSSRAVGLASLSLAAAAHCRLALLAARRAAPGAVPEGHGFAVEPSRRKRFQRPEQDGVCQPSSHARGFCLVSTA